MSKLKKLAGETILYGLGSMVPRMLNFLLLPLHTKTVYSPAEYSIIVVYMAVAAFLNVVYTFGMETTFFRFATKPGADQKRIFNQAQTAVTLISVILTACFILLADTFATTMGTPNHPEFVTWLSLVLLIDAVVAIPFAQLRLQHKPLVFALGKIINVGILIGLNYYFLVFNSANFDPEIGVGYVFVANLIANAFYLLFVGRQLITWRPSFDGAILRSMLGYASPIMITGLAGMTNEMFSRLTLEWWLPGNFYPGKSREHALGVFGACYKYAVLMNLAVQAFRFAGEPFFFGNASDKNSPVLFARVNHYFIIVCCVLLLGVGINLDILKYLTGVEYREGMSVVPILLVGYLFLGVYYNFSVWFKLTDKTYYGTVITLFGAIITIGGNFMLIPTLGYMGSALATVACYAGMTLLCYLLGRKHYPIPYTIGSDLLYIMATTGIVYAANALPRSEPILDFIFRQLVIVAFLVIVWFLEKRKLRESLAIR